MSEFALAVEQMRIAQREYFQNKQYDALKRAKHYEKRVDELLAEIKAKQAKIE